MTAHKAVSLHSDKLVQKKDTLTQKDTTFYMRSRTKVL